MKNWIRGGIVATGIVGLSFFIASTEANEEFFSKLKLTGVGSEVSFIKADTKGFYYIRNGGLYHISLVEGVTYKTSLLEDLTIHEHYKVDDGIIYTNSEGNYHSYSFYGGSKEYLNSNTLLEINDGGIVLPIVDSDGDGVFDSEDNCPSITNKDQSDIDRDGIGNKCDIDIDGDGYSNDLEYINGTNRYKGSEYPNGVLPNIPSDGVPPQANLDTDEDGVVDTEDNCPTVHNPTQWDNNENGIGNLCDPDIDGDGFSNIEEELAKSDKWSEDSTPDSINGYVPPIKCNS